MTRQRQYGREQTSFAEWVRNEDDLKSTAPSCCTLYDIDWIWHRYSMGNDQRGERRVQNIMLIEEKTRGGDLTESQRDTMFLLDQALTKYTGRKGYGERRYKSSMRGDWVPIRYWGYFKLRYSEDDIRISEWIMWNRVCITLDQLKRILLFKLNPRTLEPIDLRRHHAAPELPLLDGLGGS